MVDLLFPPFVFLPVGVSRGDIALLTLLGSSAEQNDQSAIASCTFFSQDG
jgi:hypothetical protein